MKSEIYFTYADKQTLLEIGADESTIFEDISEFSELADHQDVPFLNQVELTDEQCAKLIPKGDYCYNTISVGESGTQIIKRCPFWDKIVDFPKQSNGYCHYLKQGDWQGGLELLWDQCKCCGVNEII